MTTQDVKLRLVNLPRLKKRALLMANDFILTAFALWAGFSLRLSVLYVPPDWPFALLLLAAPVIAVITFDRVGLYRHATRYIGLASALRFFLAVGLAVTIWSLCVLLSGIAGILPRSTIIMYGVFSGTLIWASRQVAGSLLRDVRRPPARPDESQTVPVVIYGAGHMGVQLAHSLRQRREHELVGFVDEDPGLRGLKMDGLKVYGTEKLDKLIERNGVREVLLAMPELSRGQSQRILRELERHNVAVKILPAMADIATGRVTVNDLRPVDADDLLGRDAVPPDPALLKKAITGLHVMVTGAGGSIGSELTRQILDLEPATLVLFDLSEIALYRIEAELAARRNEASPTKIVAVLGSVLDRDIVDRTIGTHGIQTIYHAAAYKHVPMVEANPTAGLRNNTFGTRVIADAARELGVERFVLISTDKAVRPTSVMGASKRLAEHVLQSYAASDPGSTVFTMVRFGNVLDSSGSVVQRFRDQIARGGPVTVTHPDITRYFMSIPEAAQLVLQAGSMAEGGEVFVLDMGAPVKIDDLARSMIRLMGRDVATNDNPDGAIAIDYVGLRPGEKLYEELLVDENSTGTAHPRILRNNEPVLPLERLEQELGLLQEATDLSDLAAIRGVLTRVAEGYRPEDVIATPQPAAGSAAPASTRVH